MRGNPKFETKAERVRFAIRKKHLIDEPWSNKEIAKALNVSPEVVSRYLNQTPQAEEVKKARNALEKERWRELVTDIIKRLDKLQHLEDQLWDVVEPQVTAYEFIEADAEIEDVHLQEGGNSLEVELADTVETSIDIPVPEQWKEVPAFGKLRNVWDERRRTEEQLSNLLGLDADETLNIQGEITEQKVFAIADDAYPDSEPREIGSDPPEDEDDQSPSDDEEIDSDGAQETSEDAQ